MFEMTLDELILALRSGSRVVLQLRHAERPKIDPDDPTFGDSLELTEEGVRTSRELGKRLAEFKDDVRFFSSPLRRTIMTAEMVAEGMGVSDVKVPVDELLGNGSFYYTDPRVVVKVFNEREFFAACGEYYDTGILPGFVPLREAADACEQWLMDRLNSRLLVATTHDCFIAAFLSARGVVKKFARANWPRFLDCAAIIVDPDGTRRYAFVRTGLSQGICGVSDQSRSKEGF